MVKTDRWNAWLQIAANLGLIGGLVLVAVQIQQTRDLARLQLQLEWAASNQAPKPLIPHNLLAPPAGLEPATHGLGNWEGQPRGALVFPVSRSRTKG